jgi:hypothetical protein
LVPGEYRAEQGGAELSVSLSRTDGAWDLRRSFAEPGEVPHRASHRCSVSGDALVSVDRTLFLRPTADGILLLELKSGSDAIPATHWTHYRRLP